MNVTLIEMDRHQAREKLKAYRAAKHKDAEEEYAALAKAYEELAEGRPLLSLNEVIVNAGLDNNGFPKLAIARADRKEVCFRWMHRMAVYDYRAPKSRRRYSYGNSQLTTHVPWEGLFSYEERFALVPMVPADVRPDKGQLRDWYILWEVDQWSEQSHVARVSTDPLLLKHVFSDFYAVLAAWDLTPLEESVLNSIRRPQ